jgi:hypothetical protein
MSMPSYRYVSTHHLLCHQTHLLSLPLLQVCPEFTTTPDAFPQALALNTAAYTSLVSPMLFTSGANCSNLPGYGWEHGVATECPEGASIFHYMQADGVGLLVITSTALACRCSVIIEKRLCCLAGRSEQTE